MPVASRKCCATPQGVRAEGQRRRAEPKDQPSPRLQWKLMLSKPSVNQRSYGKLIFTSGGATSSISQMRKRRKKGKEINKGHRLSQSCPLALPTLIAYRPPKAEGTPVI